MIQWNLQVLEAWIAPGLATFTHAVILDLKADFSEAPHWLPNHYLNSVVGPTAFFGSSKIAVIGFLRRAHNAFEIYHRARSLTLSYLDGIDVSRPKIRGYYSAVSAWEDFALQTSMALDLYKWMNGGKGAFTKQDGSAEQRLYEVANQVKHTASCIASSQCTAQDTLPVWLSNTGLCSFANITVSYEEAAQILRDVATFADKLQNPQAVLADKQAARDSAQNG